MRADKVVAFMHDMVRDKEIDEYLIQTERTRLAWSSLRSTYAPDSEERLQVSRITWSLYEYVALGKTYMQNCVPAAACMQV